MLFSQIDDKFSCKGEFLEQHGPCNSIFKRNVKKMTTQQRNVRLPKSLSLSPRWFCSSVQTLDTREKYSRRSRSSLGSIFLSTNTKQEVLLLRLDDVKMQRRAAAPWWSERGTAATSDWKWRLWSSILSSCLLLRNQKAEERFIATLLTRWDRSIQHICICWALNDPEGMKRQGSCQVPGTMLMPPRSDVNREVFDIGLSF